MKALAIRKHGALDQVAVLDVPPAAVARGSVRVDLRAAALNHLDLFVIAGIPGIELSMPHVLGADGAGVVIEEAMRSYLIPVSALLTKTAIHCWARWYLELSLSRSLSQPRTATPNQLRFLGPPRQRFRSSC